MSEEKPKCVFCQQTSDNLPLVALHYQDKQYWICSSHLPVLIHEPQKLVGVLPGAEKLQPHQ